MADLSKIKLNGTEYDLKDAVARNDINLLKNSTDIVIIQISPPSEDETGYQAYYNNENITLQIFDFIKNKMNNNIFPIVYSTYDVQYYYLQDGYYSLSLESPLRFEHVSFMGGGAKKSEFVIATSNTITKNSTQYYLIQSYSSPLSFNQNTGKLTLSKNIPTKMSELTNDSDYQNSTQVNSAITTAIGSINQFEVAIVTDLPTTDINTHTIYFKSNSSSGNNVYDEYMYINNNWELIGSTQVDLSNYLQNSDIADWAKQANKPIYTANEVGALPNTTVIPTVPTDVSAFNNDAGYLTSYTETDPTVPAWAKATNKPTYTAAEVGALPDTTVIPAAQVNADWDATSGVAQILHKPTIPTVPTNVSAFTNDSGYLTSYTETDPTVPAWAKAESKPTYTAAEVGALPADTIIPTVPTNVSAFTNDAGYLTSYTETDPTVPSWAKASTKPTYTASEVGAAASSHVHGNVKNDGTITVNTSMANGDRLLFSDTSDSSKIKNSNITIGTSTTQYLANNGTWQNLPTVSVSQTLTSGTEIGSVNNTKLYAPVPYDDSALAARVTALEQLEWATYYSGRSNPSNSQGQNGDIYLQY